MSKLTKEKLIEEGQRVAGQANQFEFKVIHVFVALVVAILAVFGGLYVFGLM